MGVLELCNEKEWNDMLVDSTSKLKVVHFWADWAPQCQQMNEVLDELGNDKEYQDVKFFRVVAENFVEISQKNNVASVPTFIFLKNKEVVDHLEGANVPELTKKIKFQLSKLYFPSTDSTNKGQTQEDLNSRLSRLINSAPCMLFMKGSTEQPRCGFSRQVIELLGKHSAEYQTFDILQDEEVRQGLKEFSKWPTYPQLYINGKLIGGIDILKELSESGELDNMLPQTKKPDLTKRLKELINKSKVMVFMKGSPDAARCGFSKTLVEIFKNMGVKYDTFDILQDEEVRQGLKSYSNWPTYPQIYVKGNLIGGVDIIKELQEAGELKSTLEGQ